MIFFQMYEPLITLIECLDGSLKENDGIVHGSQDSQLIENWRSQITIILKQLQVHYFE